MGQGSAKETRTEKRREQILSAARTLFLGSGFDGVSTDAIVKAAGVASKETLYRYFASKEDLFLAVIQSMTVNGPQLTELFDQEPLISTDEELRAVLHSFIRKILDAMLQPDYLALIRITIAEIPRFPALAQHFREAVPLRAMEKIQQLLKQGQVAGLVRTDKDPAIIARMALGTLLSFGVFDGLLVAGGQPKPPGPKIINGIVDNLMDVASTKHNDSRESPDGPR
ncbi:MAG TPA: TetR/AcrR family transcriptional regulator [Spirochaetia bacterium]|nr:TetR/AcrR family transcriptional regulator [Spirochaetia bacterium]